MDEKFLDAFSCQPITTEYIGRVLKRAGYKSKSAGDYVYCDVGRKPHIAFYADTPRGYAMLACAMQGADPFRALFKVGSDVENAPLHGIATVFSVEESSALNLGAVGYCYGAHRRGYLNMQFDYCGKSKDYFLRQVELICSRSSMALNILDSAFELYFFDGAKLEDAIMRIERAAQAADGQYGCSHTFIANKFCPPLINDSFAVDMLRAATNAVAVPCGQGYTEFSLLHAPLCLAEVGSDGGEQAIEAGAKVIRAIAHKGV